MLPPTSDSLLQHLRCANYQINVWRSSLEPAQHRPPPEANGVEQRRCYLKASAHDEGASTKKLVGITIMSVQEVSIPE